MELSNRHPMSAGMNATYRCAFAIVIAFTSVLDGNPAFGGGTAIPVTVKSFDEKGLVVLHPLKSLPEFEGCEDVTIEVHFQWLRWWWNDDAGVTKKSHREALQRLSKAAGTNDPVLFGVMGEGLGKVLESKCRFRSNGLAPLNDANGQAIYSFYRWP